MPNNHIIWNAHQESNEQAQIIFHKHRCPTRSGLTHLVVIPPGRPMDVAAMVPKYSHPARRSSFLDWAEPINSAQQRRPLPYATLSGKYESRMAHFDLHISGSFGLVEHICWYPVTLTMTNFLDERTTIATILRDYVPPAVDSVPSAQSTNRIFGVADSLFILLLLLPPLLTARNLLNILIPCILSGTSRPSTTTILGSAELADWNYTSLLSPP